MDECRIFDLTKQLIAIDSVTGKEAEIVAFLEDELLRRGMQTQRFEVFEGRFNLLGYYEDSNPDVLFNTHIDTVPPQYGPHESKTRIYGRGACDTHGILAAMLEALGALRLEGIKNTGIVLVVDEEGGEHGGARHAGQNLQQPKLLVVGEPTQNKLASYQKGLLKADLTAHGTEGHSGYPELWDSALDRLIRAITHLQAQSWMTTDSSAGTTMNAFIKSGGDAYNKVPAHAQAGLFFRLAEPLQHAQQRVQTALTELNDDLLDIEWLGGNDPVDYLSVLDGFETCVAAYNTDIAHFGWRDCPTYLCGPGSILVAHRDLRGDDWDQGEWIEKEDLIAGAHTYVRLVKTALAAHLEMQS